MTTLGDVRAMGLVSPAGCTGKGPAWLLTHHGEGADTGLHGALMLLLQPRTLEQPRGGLQQLNHNCLVCLQGTGPRGSSASPAGTGPGPSLPQSVCGPTEGHQFLWHRTTSPGCTGPPCESSPQHKPGLTAILTTFPSFEMNVRKGAVFTWFKTQGLAPWLTAPGALTEAQVQSLAPTSDCSQLL